MAHSDPSIICYQCPECKMRSSSDGYRIGVIDGEGIERKAIVEWLRSYNYQTAGTLLAANAIERGEHLK